MKKIKIIIVFILLIITYYSLKLPDPKSLTVHINDKLGHFLAYASLATHVLFLCNLRKEKLIGMILMISYGFLMELLQGFVPGRDPSFLDMIANSSGILVGLVIFLLFKKQIIALYTKIHVLN